MLRSKKLRSLPWQRDKTRPNQYWPGQVMDESQLDGKAGQNVSPMFRFSLRAPVESLMTIEGYLIALQIPYSEWPETVSQLFVSEPLQLWERVDSTYIEQLSWPHYCGFVINTSTEIVNIAHLHEFASIPRMSPIEKETACKGDDHYHKEYWCAARYVQHLTQCCEKVSLGYLTNEGKWSLLVTKTRVAFPELYADELFNHSATLDDLFAALKADAGRDVRCYKKLR